MDWQLPPRTLIRAQAQVRLVAANANRLTRLELANSFLEISRSEVTEGYANDDTRLIRDAAEKAWLAVLQGTDHAMSRRDLIPEPGAMVQVSRHAFFDKAGRQDLSDEMSVFEDWLHERIFNFGAVPGREEMETLLDEVARFVRAVSEEL
jgi:hypothetical protein